MSAYLTPFTIGYYLVFVILIGVLIWIGIYGYIQLAKEEETIKHEREYKTMMDRLLLYELDPEVSE